MSFGASSAEVPGVWYMGNNLKVMVVSTKDYITMTMGGYTEQRAVVSGGCEFSLTPFLRALINTDGICMDGAVVTTGTWKSKATGKENITLDDGSGTVTQAVPWVFGGYSLAEAYDAEREVWMACDDPAEFRVVLRLDGSQVSVTVAVTVDGVAGTATLTPEYGGNVYGIDALTAAADWSEIVVECDEYWPKATQQKTLAKVATTLHIINTGGCVHGSTMAVRWLDAEGRLHCRSLMVAERAQSVESGERYTRAEMAEVGADKWINGNAHYRQSVAVKQLATLAAPSQRRELIDELMTLAASEWVCVKAGGIWVRANVVDSETSVNRNALQDFAVQLELSNLETLVR